MRLTDADLDAAETRLDAVEEHDAESIYEVDYMDVASESQADVPALIADLREARATIARVEALADQMRHMGNDLPSIEEAVENVAASSIRAALEGES